MAGWNDSYWWLDTEIWDDVTDGSLVDDVNLVPGIGIIKYNATIYVLEYQGTASLEAGSDEYTCNLTNHSLQTDDFIVNLTRRGTEYSSSERGSRRIEVTTTNSFIIFPAIADQTEGDEIMIHKFVDISNRVLNNNIKINKKIGNNTANLKIRMG